MHILIADDDIIGREWLAKQLLEWGHDVCSATDGEEAWRLFVCGEYDVVITDWVMPNVDGLELIRRIRNNQRTKYSYVILLTVKDQLDDLVEGMEAGADDYLRKPFDTSELRVRLGAGERVISYEQTLSDANARMKQELEAAAMVQRSLLPSLREMGGGRFAWALRPCDELAGDILNIVPIGANHVGLAGPALLIKGSGDVCLLDSTGPIIGVDEDAEFEEMATAVEPGDRLFVYSDGIVEAANGGGERYGLERLVRFLRQADGAPIDETVRGLCRHVEEWAQPQVIRDDISCFAAEALPKR